MLFGALLQISGLALLYKPSLRSFLEQHSKSKPSSPSLEYGYQDGTYRRNSPGRYEGRDLHKIATGQIRGCSLALGYIFLEPGYRFIITQPSTEHNDRSLKRAEEHFHFISACVSRIHKPYRRPTANFISSSYDFMRHSLSFRDINN